MFKNRLLTLLIGCYSWLGMGTFLMAQPKIGLPIIRNHSKETYQAGTQNWDLAQDERGIIYIANNEGLLTYDGTTWQCFPVKNKTIVRSLLLSKSGKIYVGSQGEFGYFEANKFGRLVYHSLMEKVPKNHKNFADVWDVAEQKGNVFFRTATKVFQYDGKTIRVIATDKRFEFLGKCGNKLYLHDAMTGLMQLQTNGKLKPLPNTDFFKNTIVTEILPFSKDTLLITTLKNGIFLYDGQMVKPWELHNKHWLADQRVYCATLVKSNLYAFGTVAGGVFLANQKGEITEVINIEKGLQNNTLLDIFTDLAGNLWLAQDNGIDYLETNSPFSMIRPDENLMGTGYAVKIFQNKIYFGTSNGLFSTVWKSPPEPQLHQNFNRVKNAEGQVWNLDILKDQLLMGHHEGTFEVSTNEATSLAPHLGTWAFIPLKGAENHLLVGNYTGLNLYQKKENGGWEFAQKIEGMPEESCRIMAQDEDGNIWISHPYRGVFKVRLNETHTAVTSIKLYNSKDGFPSDLYIHVFKIAHAVVFAAEKGIYEYNEAKDRFELSQSWSKLIPPDLRTQCLIEDPKGNIWFVVDDEVGVFWVEDFGVGKTLQKQYFPQLKSKLVAGFEHIYPYDKNNVFFPSERGFLHLDPSRYKAQKNDFFTLLRQVKTQDTAVVFHGWGDLQRPVRFDSPQHTLLFSFSATSFSDFSKVEYQFFLKGFDKDWSVWGNKTEKEYTNLPYGKYTFLAKARTAQGQETQPAVFEFEILPPWYATRWTLAIFVLTFLLILFGLIWIPRFRFEKEKAFLKSEQQKTLQEQEEAHQRIVAQNEREISRLTQEKLKSEVEHKNQELATTTMHLVQKGEFLLKIQEELGRIIKNSKDPTTRKELTKVVKLLNEDEQRDEDWQQFANYFDQVHGDFLKRLKEIYPQLTPKDQRLCTYLRMNLSTKEIAPLMNISVRGIEISRYRLRRKLNIGTEVNLNDFMMNF